MKRIIFVGMHNKPGMKPLDSKTISGKLIDAIIFRLQQNCIKTNLCEVDYMPKNIIELNSEKINWQGKYEPNGEDVIVLLGNWVHKNFLSNGFNIIKLAHPASCFGRVNKEKYVLNAVKLINAF